MLSTSPDHLLPIFTFCFRLVQSLNLLLWFLVHFGSLGIHMEISVFEHKPNHRKVNKHVHLEMNEYITTINCEALLLFFVLCVKKLQ